MQGGQQQAVFIFAQQFHVALQQCIADMGNVVGIARQQLIHIFRQEVTAFTCIRKGFDS